VTGSDVLPGDGYDDYLKPFRTVEDLHVHGAMCGLVLGLCARIEAPRPPRERLLATLVAIRELALADPRSHAVHLALGGVIATVDAAVRELEPSFAALEPETRAAWERDRVLFSVAAKARAARLEAAWRAGAR
jgi:acyl-CoA dehydrogenase